MIEYLLGRAEVFTLLKNKDKAKADYDSVLKLDAKNQDALDGLEVVKNLNTGSPAPPAPASPDLAKATAAMIDGATFQEAVLRLEQARAATEQAQLSAALAQKASAPIVGGLTPSTTEKATTDTLAQAAYQEALARLEQARAAAEAARRDAAAAAARKP